MKEVTAAVLLVLALAMGLSSRLAPALAGLAPFGAPSLDELDTPPEQDDREAPRFFAERDRVDLVIPRGMTVDEALRVYQVDFPHVLRQLAEQEGVETLRRDHVLRQGARYEITLTPEAEDVP